MKTGKIAAVCISEKKGEKKVDIGEGYLKANHGLEGDAHAGEWHRQLSLLAVESVNKMKAKGADVVYGDFAENLTVAGIELHTLPIGSRLRTGQGVLLEVTQIGKKCHHGCAIFQQVGDCVMPREGIFVRVLEGGPVKIDDPITVIFEPAGAAQGPQTGAETIPSEIL
ncbi:MAG: MOSC domain-containing protein [Solirubrobacterales bacterium]